MTFDDQLRRTTDRTLAALRGHVEAEVRTLVQQLLEAAADEQRTAVARGREQIATELRRAAAAELDAAAREAHERLEAAHRQFDQQLGEIRRHADAQIESVRHEAHQQAEDVVVAQLAAAQAEHDRAIADAADRVRIDGCQSELAAASRLLDWVRALDDCRTLTAVLEVLLEAAAGEAPRVALLVAGGDRLRGFGFKGFEIADARQIDIGMADAGVAGAAAQARARVAAAYPAAPGEVQPPVFAAWDGERLATATPVLVGGEVVAVLYADAPRTDGLSATSRWPAIVELMVRHAGRCLESLMATRALGASVLGRGVPRPRPSVLPRPFESTGSPDDDAARRYARLLVSEICVAYGPAVEAGRREGNVGARVGREIERARTLYEARIPPTVRARNDYFEQELVRTLADGDRTLLGQLT